MELLAEVEIENDMPVDGFNSWNVPDLSTMTLLPITHLFRNPDMKFEWIEENVFRVYRDDNGEIKLQFPMGTKDFKLLAYCVARVIDGMANAVLDTDWGVEYVRRESKKAGILTPQTQVRGPLKL